MTRSRREPRRSLWKDESSHLFLQTLLSQLIHHSQRQGCCWRSWVRCCRRRRRHRASLLDWVGGCGLPINHERGQCYRTFEPHQRVC